MRQNKKIKKRLAACLMGGVISLLVVFGGAAVTCAQADQQEQQEVRLEKTASWTSPVDYQALIDLKVTGIESYTQKEVPISVIPILDVTGSMDHCDTPGHFRKLYHHWVGFFEDAAAIWREIIVPALPTPEEYGRMGLENADDMFLELPRELDPSGKCRLAYLKGRGDQKDYYTMTHWRVFYVTDDVTPLRPLREGNDGGYAYGHTVFKDGVYLPVGTAEQAGPYIAWSYTNLKESGHGCVCSRLDQLKGGYTQFIQTLFENPGARVCPVAFVGGYYIGGWTDDAQKAADFIAQEGYLKSEQVLPDHDLGTNYEAALAGAVDAVARMEEKGDRENTFAILFTDGAASSGYDHSSGKTDPSRIDPHSFGMPDQDESWYPTYAQWAIEDAELLKSSVAVYSVGYGTSLDEGSAMETLQKISSGGEYFIDSRSTSDQTVTDIFRAIYSDIIYKATKVHIVDYISEFWDIEEDRLPEGCQVEQIQVTGRDGQPTVIYRLTYPVTREMGADGQEEIQIPVILREGYRDVQEKTAYETDQDAPLDKGPEEIEEKGAYVEYVDLDGKEQRTSAAAPSLDVYPAQPDLLLEKEAVTQKVRAGEEAQYRFRLANCGQAEWADIRLEDVFARQDVKLLFDQTEGAVLENEGEGIRIESLGLGEEKTFTGRAQIPEDAQGSLENTVTAIAKDPRDPGREIRKEAKASLTVDPLSMDFEVEKTVDKAQARPGDVLTYQIRIVNTGERGLCSTVVTDRSAREDVQAVFQEQEGVGIKEDGTQAVIESIRPGEEVILTATAKIPEGSAEEELINTVLASPDGGKGPEKTSQAAVIVKRTVSEDTVSGDQIQQPPQDTATDIPATDIPVTDVPATDVPATDVPSANISSTDVPSANASSTGAPGTSAANGAHTVTGTSRPGTGTSTGSGTGSGTDGKGSASGTAGQSPDTGDRTPLLPLVLLLGVSGIALLILGYCWKRRIER